MPEILPINCKSKGSRNKWGIIRKKEVVFKCGINWLFEDKLTV